MELTTLAALLLFLGEGQSGYDVRRLFQTTPIAVFSDSPGVIYPALARLERGGLLSSEAKPSARRRRIYRRTPAGNAALDQWLRGAITTETIERRPQDIELRYVLITFRFGAAAACRFLDEAAQAFDRRLTQLEAFRAANTDMGSPSLDALGLGVILVRTRLQWCRDTKARWEGR